MASFHELKVSDVKKETSDCVSIGFEVPDEIKNEYQFDNFFLVKRLMNFFSCFSKITASGLDVSGSKKSASHQSYFRCENGLKFLFIISP